MREILGRRRRLLSQRSDGKPELIDAALTYATQWRWPVMPGTVQSGSGQPQRECPCGCVVTPGSTGHCHSVAKVRAALISSDFPSPRRSLRRLPRISRMSARSFPLHRWQHRGPHHTMCRSLHCAYLLAHHTLAASKGNPYGPSVGCFRGSLVHTASTKSMGVAWGGEVWRFAVARFSLRLRHGRMGHDRQWLRRPGPSPGSGWSSTTPGLHRVRTHHDRCDAPLSETSRPQYPVP